MTEFHVVIPARYASTRLPGKPLREIAGCPMIEWVFRCGLASGAVSTTVATDDQRIADAVAGFGGRVCLTRSDHRSGTDRIAEAVELMKLDPDAIVVNLQGDEPEMPGALIRQVAETLAGSPDAVMATACHRIESRAEFVDPNVVKVTRDQRGNALYFSRAPIPWPRDARGEWHPEVPAFRHIGLYAYRAGFIRRFAGWAPCAVEETEVLEQLRVLWAGERIAVCDAEEMPAPGIDAPADLEQARRRFAARKPD